MITKYMSDSEIVKELEIIENTIMSRHKVYWKRFGKQLQDEKCKHNTILRVKTDILCLECMYFVNVCNTNKEGL